jgi:hypothetical protein
MPFKCVYNKGTLDFVRIIVIEKKTIGIEVRDGFLQSSLTIWREKVFANNCS